MVGDSNKIKRMAAIPLFAGMICTCVHPVLPPMLLNEAQKQHKAIEALQAENQALRSDLATIKAELAEIQALLKR